MGCEVYANNNEIACKAGDGKVIAAMPDVCLTPPPPPAGPIPIPYPDTSFSKDMQQGSKTVMIKDQEVMLKDQSFYKSSPLGDEAATNGQGAGVVTHVITGKTFFNAWSMDVQFEGQNVDRNLDLTTSNHASPPPNEGAPMPNMAALAVAAVVAAPPPPEKCKCCGRDVHSQAQQSGNSLSEDQFYDTADPANKAVLDGIRADPNCKDVLPDPAKPECNKYYKTTPAEKGKIEKKWDRHKKRHGLQGQQYAHKVPKAAGGCPTNGDTGDNVAPVKPGCEPAEKAVQQLQDRRFKALGWR
jgi:hypothetical protein